MDGLEFGYHPKYGLALFATRDFQKGEILLSEKPLIVSRTLTSKRDKAFAYTYDIDLEVFSTFKAFFDSSTEVQSHILNNFYLPSTQESMDVAWSQVGSICLDRIIDVCQKHIQAWSNINRDIFKKVFLVFTFNSHAFGSDNSPAIFAIGSKMNHSCEANTFYQSIDNQVGIHTVAKEIRKGDQITTNYLGKDTIFSTGTRQKILQRTKLFQCDCPRCTEKLDISRGLPCPNNCPIDGYIYWHPSTPNDRQSHWICDTCNSRIDDNNPYLNELLVKEKHIEQQIIALNERLSDIRFMNESQLLDLHNACLSQLGSRHWTYILVLKMMIIFDATQLSEGKYHNKTSMIKSFDNVLNWYDKGEFDIPRYLVSFTLHVANVLFYIEDYYNSLRFLGKVFMNFPYNKTFLHEYKEAIDLMERCHKALDESVSNQENKLNIEQKLSIA
ncbi:SET domain-containing protein [Gigaspora margarita]|uniref:SET domain-containing protein n=1 Tax=Gigaspora margarita TaxID=4874 RepID=A0A8H3X407_GIGMA|nr:SET domain-containing protein [Gigaspora margarita]